MPELPIRDTVAESYRIVLDRRRALLFALIVPIAMLVVLNLSEGYVWQLSRAIRMSSIWIFLGDHTGLRPLILDIFWVISSALYLVPVTYFGVAWQSALVLRRDQDNVRPTVMWRQSHTYFIRAAVLLWFLAVLLSSGYVIACAAIEPTFIDFLTKPFSFYSPFPVAVFILTVMLGLYVFARLSLILLPAGKGIVSSVKDSIQRTRAHDVRLVLIFFVALLPLLVFQFLISKLWLFLSPYRRLLCDGDQLESRVRDIVTSICAMDLPLDLTAQLFQFVCISVVLTVIYVVKGELSGEFRRRDGQD